MLAALWLGVLAFTLMLAFFTTVRYRTALWQAESELLEEVPHV